MEGGGHEHHLWDVEKVAVLVADREKAETFFCGGSRNFPDFIDWIDAVFVLEVDLDTLNRRLDQRPEDEWGARPSERELVVRLHQSGEDTPDGIGIDATTVPVARVVDEILSVAALNTESSKRRAASLAAVDPRVPQQSQFPQRRTSWTS